MSDGTPEEQRWRRALESGTFGVWDLDLRREMVHYSPEWKARLGFPRVHAPDSTAFWRCRVHPEDFEPMLGSLRSHIEGHSPTYEMRFRLRSNGSGYRTMLSRGRVVGRDDKGNATRMVGTMVDLTDRPAHAAPHGLATEDSRHIVEVAQAPFHALIGVRGPQTDTRVGVASQAPIEGRLAAVNEKHEARRFIDLVDDLLDRALREGFAARQR
jgi:PAS domain S-box-containing protein